MEVLKNCTLKLALIFVVIITFTHINGCGDFNYVETIHITTIVRSLVELPCNVKSDRLLNWVLTGGKTPTYIALGTVVFQQLQQKYSINLSRKMNGNTSSTEYFVYNLIINEATEDFEGIYVCTEDGCNKSNVLFSVQVSPTISLLFDGHTFSNETFEWERKVEKGKTIKVTCRADGGRPAANITWKINGEEDVNSSLVEVVNLKPYTKDNNTFNSTSTLAFTLTDENVTVTCTSSLQDTGINKSISATFYPLGDVSTGDGFSVPFWAYVCGIVGSTVPVFLIGLCLGLIVTRRNKVSKANVSPDYDIPLSERSVSGITNIPGNVHSICRPNPQEGKVGSHSKENKDLTDVQLIAQLPGEGKIKYWSADASTKQGNSVNIIAKCISDDAQMKEHLNFRELAEGLSTLPKHRNIVEILGISTKDVPYYIYFEHLQGVTLKDFLLRNYQQSDTPGKMAQSGDANTMQLTRFSLDVADGMMFLTQRDYCHPALRTRKILLNEKGICKLYDFWPNPMSTDRITQIFQKRHPPVAWLSPEVIFLCQYTDKSDVWNFAVLLWEIYSIGQTPYNGLSCDEIEQEIRANRNLEQPLSCPGAIFGMMLVSWDTSMNKRPDLSDWRKKLVCILQSTEPEDNANHDGRGVHSSQYFTLENNSKYNDHMEQYNVCYGGRRS